VGMIVQNMISQINFAADIPELEAVEMELIYALSDSRGTVREMSSYTLNAGGKRIRPMLVIYSGMLFSGKTDNLIRAAAAAELIHMASLVHDDVIDCSDLRRNKPSVRSVWGNHFAVISGDYLFAKAFSILSSNRLNKSMDFMVEAIGNMCHGEILQAEDRFNCNLSLNRYYEKIAMKTAIFLKCCCQSGAAISGAGDDEIDVMGEYGLNLGFAFQIMDDLLDYYGCTDVMGKPKNEDLRQGNITLPIIFLLENELYGSWIRSIITRNNFDDSVMEEICTVLRETKIIDKCFDIVLEHIEKAKQCLEMIPESRYHKSLINLADLIKSRVN